jgi:lipopolysaccharide/colanic/teichoic acid biosynthesis glycosyltransferase
MIWLMIYPAVAVVVALVVGIIMLILKFGPVLFKARHHTLSRREFDDGAFYEQTISYA